MRTLECTDDTIIKAITETELLSTINQMVSGKNPRSDRTDSRGSKLPVKAANF